MVTKIVELPPGARALFDERLKNATLFHLPRDADPNAPFHAIDIVAAFRDWKDAGIMPFGVTAIEIQSPYPSDRLTCVFWMEGDMLSVSGRNALCYDDGLRITNYFYAVYHEGSTGLEILPAAKNEKDRSLAREQACLALYRINWLIEALQSLERSSFKRPPLSRQASRATGYPRESWEITIRRKHTRGVLSNREIFRDVIKAAFAVRAHMRTNHRTGEKTIKVHSYVKGGTDAKPKVYRVTRDDES